MTDRHPLVLVADLGLALGDTHINRRPGLYHVKVDEQWELWLNPHREETGNIEAFMDALEARIAAEKGKR